MLLTYFHFMWWIKRPIVLFFLSIFILFSCKKEDEMPFGLGPEISLVSMGPSVAQAGVDSIWFVINYRDGDGDLGDNNPDARNLFVVDDRMNLKYEMRIRQLAPDPGGVPITGNLEFTIGTTVLKGPWDWEWVNYSIQVIDRAGRTSNLVICPRIEIKR